MSDRSNLSALASGLSDSYPDFVRWVTDSADIHGIGEELASYMEGNPDAMTSDVLRYEGELTGIKEPLEIIDD